MTHYTLPQIEELERMAALATAGPWSLGKLPNDHEIVVTPRVSKRQDGLMIASCSNTWLDDCKNNPAFIAASRTAVPYLCADWRTLHEERQWRPIETAPQSNATDEHYTYFLVWVADGGSGKGCHAFGYKIGAQVIAVGYNGKWKITHWMPLPAAPA